MPPNAQLIGQTLNDRYCLTSLLGEQAGRQTFLAEDRQAIEQDTPSQVVVKLFLFGPTSTWESFKLFEREVATLQTLNHPAIPAYIDTFEVETALGKGFALVQTYVPHRSLREWVETGRHFSEADIVDIATALLNILIDLHGLHPPVIHRDIKPSNILLGDRSGHGTGSVFLVDFGAVQAVDSGGTRTIVGTYGYMPLEQFGGRAVAASDLYSLGATLIYLASGQHPANLPQHNLRIAFESQVSLSRPMVVWLTWLTQPDLSQRPSDAAAALQRLQSLQTSPLTASPTSAFPPVHIRTAADQVDIDLAHRSLQKKKTLIFNYRRHQALQQADGVGCAIYMLMAPLLLGAALLGQPPGLRWWFGTFWLWYPILMGLLWPIGPALNRMRQRGLKGYRLKLETREGEKYISLLGLSKERELETEMTLAVPVGVIYDLYRRGYQFTFLYRDRKTKDDTRNQRFAILLAPSQLQPLLTALETWHPELNIRKAFQVKPEAQDPESKSPNSDPATDVPSQ